MALKFYSTAAIAAIAIAACEPAAEGPPPPPPTEPSGQAALDQQAAANTPEIRAAQEIEENVATEERAKINWKKARREFAEQGGIDEDSNFSIASANEPPPAVPVLLPSGNSVSVASSGQGPRFKQTNDGYYAVYKYENYDVIVNGTNQVIGARADGERDETPKYTAAEAGAQVSFSRYGADYLVEFECYDVDPETGTCIEEEEAMGVAESLVIRRTRGT